MTASRTDGTEAWTSWLSSFPLCCAPLASHRENTKRQGRSKSLSNTNCAMSRPNKAMMSDEELLISKVDEKKTQPVVYDQPLYQPHPMAGPGTERYQQSFGERTSRRNAGSVRKPARKRFWSASAFSARRPEISAPSNFRHISSASPSFTPREPTTPPPKARPSRNPRPGSFRPLELSIYMVESSPSPILAHFEAPTITAPAPVYTPDQVDEDRPLVHQKSVSSSSMSFHIPRRQPWDSSPSSKDTRDSQAEELPPLIPQKSRSRNRGYTSSDVESIKERVASAMAEVDKIQQQIDDVIERQSVYTISRPSTPHSVAPTIPSEPLTHFALKGAVQTSPDLEPMPSIPALPPSAPSFAQRLNSDVARPRTAPLRAPVPGPPRRIRTPEEVSAAFRAPLRIRSDDRPLPPPLPLVLRPPLRKKKSFSRVSNWLFPGSEHNRDLSVDSITNVPRPIKGNEGFYQCVSQDEARGRRRNMDSIDTISTWESDAERTAPTAYSPGSTPAAKQEDPFLSRTVASGNIDSHPRRMSVGVAY